MPEEQSGGELEDLRALLRSAGPEPVEWEAPPADLWARIAEGASAVTADIEPHDVGPARPLDQRRRRQSVRWIVGVAAVLVVIAVGVAAWTQRSDDTTVLATTDLEVLGEAAGGSAEIVDHNGALQLRLVTEGLSVPDGFTEVWLINPEVTELVSLGPIRRDGTYDLPPGLDPSAFPIVDVSFEPLDGNPEHSGNSVLRGQLTF